MMMMFAKLLLLLMMITKAAVTMMIIWSGHQAQAPGSLQTDCQAARLIATPIDRPQGEYHNCDDDGHFDEDIDGGEYD